MKKLLCLTLICVLFVTGCGKEHFELNLKEIGENITKLELDDFARVSAANYLDDKIEGLSSVYDLKKTFNIKLDSDTIEESNVAVNKKKTAMYFIIKPADGEKETVKTAIDKYIDSLKKNVKSKLTYKEYQEYLIYIIADNSENLLNEIKQLHSKVFNNLMDIDDDSFTQTFDIEKDLVDEYLAKVPMMVINSNSVIILKPAKGKTKDVQEKMDDYMTKLEEQWKTYLPDQYDLVKNRLEEEYGDYLIYVISKDNDAVFDIIKDAKIEEK